MRTIIESRTAPRVYGTYSQAVKANGFVFVSGQLPIDPTTQEVISGGAADQTERVIQNISAILDASGSSLGSVVKSTVFLKNIGDFAAMNEVYGKYFRSEYPARATVEVARLPKDVLVEIEVIAVAN